MPSPRPTADIRLTLILVFGTAIHAAETGILVFGTITVLAITPFAYYRFSNQQFVAGLVDVLIQLCIGAVALYAWRGGNLDRAGWAVSIFNSIGCVLVGQLVGLPGALWLYPVLLSNFLLAPRRTAVVISLLAVGALSFNDALGSLANALSFVLTAAMVSLFAYIFSNRADAQRQLLEVLATRDPLTGAINRRGFEREIEPAMAAAIRDGTPLGLAVLDLDGFKQVNDQNGHEAGDAVLVQFARIVRGQIRKSDHLLRIGGDEFVLVLPGADAGTLARITESVRQRVHERLRCGEHAVTVSIGAAPLLPGESMRDWLHRADTAMYLAKREGCNRVVVDRG